MKCLRIHAESSPGIYMMMLLVLINIPGSFGANTFIFDFSILPCSFRIDSKRTGTSHSIPPLALAPEATDTPNMLLLQKQPTTGRKFLPNEFSIWALESPSNHGPREILIAKTFCLFQIEFLWAPPSAGAFVVMVRGARRKQPSST